MAAPAAKPSGKLQAGVINAGLPCAQASRTAMGTPSLNDESIKPWQLSSQCCLAVPKTGPTNSTDPVADATSCSDERIFSCLACRLSSCSCPHWLQPAITSSQSWDLCAAAQPSSSSFKPFLG